jgi:signal transduction histidine kinase
MKRKDIIRIALVAGALATGGAAWAASAAAAPAVTPATADEAVAMVKKGVAFIKANGAERGYAAITDRANKDFHDRDLYLAVHRIDGTCIAHGTNPKMVGKNFIEMKDIDGKEYIKERVELAKAKSTFWTDYKFPNPVTKKIEPKTAYCERLADTIVCGGIYK